LTKDTIGLYIFFLNNNYYMEGSDYELEIEESPEHESTFDTELEVLECTDYNEYKDVIKGLEEKGFKHMYEVPNSLLKQHLDHFKATGRFKAITLVTIFTDPNAKQKKHKIDKANTDIWYKD